MITPIVVTNVDTIEDYDELIVSSEQKNISFSSYNKTCKNIYSSIKRYYKNVTIVINSGAYRLELM